MTEGIDIYGTRKKNFQSGRSRSKIFNDFYKPKMDRYLDKSYEKKTKDGNITVGFSKKGNKHLFSDTYVSRSGLQKIDLLILPKLLKNAEYYDEAELSHERKDTIVKFYYYKVRAHGSDLFLNVAKDEYIDKRGIPHTSYYLYSVTNRVR